MRRSILVVALLTTVPILSLQGQTPAAPPSAPVQASGHQQRTPWAFWTTGFLGTAAMNGASGSTGGLAFSYQRDRAVWSLRAQIGANDQPCPSSDCGPDFGELALLFGYGTRAGKTLHASAGAGISVAGDDTSGGFGLPLEVQVNWRPTRVLGAGLYAWANSLGPAFGLAAAVHLGRLR